MGTYSVKEKKEETAIEINTMSNSKFVKVLAATFLSEIDKEDSWGKNQIMHLFESIMPNQLLIPRTLPSYITKEFARKIEINNFWGKNRIELIFVKAVANAALIMLDNQ